MHDTLVLKNCVLFQRIPDVFQQKIRPMFIRTLFMFLLSTLEVLRNEVSSIHPVHLILRIIQNVGSSVIPLLEFFKFFISIQSWCQFR